MSCPACGNKSDDAYYHVCDDCYGDSQNLPTKVTESAWVAISRKTRRKEKVVPNPKLHDFILYQYSAGSIEPDPENRRVLIGDKLAVPVDQVSTDKLARESGLVVGKWLVYVSADQIDDVWQTIASATLKGELGVDAKVATARQASSAGGEYVICVYTENYLNMEDVQRVRDKLRELGFTQRLYYKPDIYTYLGIYSKVFPGVRASRYAD